MKKLFVVANWKSNKTIKEAEEWLRQFSIFPPKADPPRADNSQFSMNLEIIICPPFTVLYTLGLKVSEFKGLKFKLGAQDVSPFPDGAYTGEVSARMLKDLGAEYVLIGHSERRKYFKEDTQILENKVREALDVGLNPIFCVQEKTTPLPSGVKIIAYEPVFAIGTDTPDNPENADEVARVLKERVKSQAMVLYGGSVSPENVKSFSEKENLTGVLIGGASLDAKTFLAIIKNAF